MNEIEKELEGINGYRIVEEDEKLNVFSGEIIMPLSELKKVKNKGIQQGREEQKQKDIHLVRTSGFYFAEKLACKIGMKKEVRWYTQEEVDKAIQKCREDKKEILQKIVDESNEILRRVKTLNGAIYTGLVEQQLEIIKREIDFINKQ